MKDPIQKPPEPPRPAADEVDPEYLAWLEELL